MIYINSKIVELTPAHFNHNKQGERADKAFASLGDSKTHIFSRPKDKLPRMKYNEDGSKTILMGQKGVSFEPRYRIVDGTTPKDIMYSERPVKFKDGDVVPQTLKYLEFRESGIFNVDSKKQPDLWYFMYNHPRCGGGPNYDSSRPPMFELIDPGAADRETIEAYETEMEVAKALIAMSDDVAVEVCVILSLGRPDMKPELAKPKLKARAKVTPEAVFKAIMIAMKDQASHDLSSLIKQMNDVDVAAFDVKEKAWYFLRDNRRLGKKIVTVNAAQEPEDVIKEYLSDPDNSETLVSIRSKVSVAEKSKEVYS